MSGRIQRWGKEVSFLLCVESKSQASIKAEEKWYLKKTQRDAQGMFLEYFFPIIIVFLFFSLQ